MVDRDEDLFMNTLKDLLDNKEFKCGEYSSFIKSDRGKERVIHKLPYYPDRIVQHAILQVLEPIWKKTLIDHTFQAIKGRGVHLCLKHVKRAVQEDGMSYCLEIDIKKFYPSIDNEILKDVLSKKIKCKDTLNILYEIVDGSEGVPIGNYISQYFGNLYLSELDHYIKEVLRVRHYYRYCDDLIVLSNDKAELREVLKYTKKWLKSVKLEIKENRQVFKITDRRGVGCLGYVVYKDKIKLRRNIVTEFESSVNSMVRSGKINLNTLGSYYGWIKHTESSALWIKSINKLLPIADNEQRSYIVKLTVKLNNISRRAARGK